MKILTPKLMSDADKQKAMDFLKFGPYGKLTFMGLFETAFLEFGGSRIQFESFASGCIQDRVEAEHEQELWLSWMNELRKRYERGDRIIFVRKVPTLTREDYKDDPSCEIVKLTARFATLSPASLSCMMKFWDEMIHD